MRQTLCALFMGVLFSNAGMASPMSTSANELVDHTDYSAINGEDGFTEYATPTEVCWPDVIDSWSRCTRLDLPATVDHHSSTKCSGLVTATVLHAYGDKASPLFRAHDSTLGCGGGTSIPLAWVWYEMITDTTADFLDHINDIRDVEVGDILTWTYRYSTSRCTAPENLTCHYLRDADGNSAGCADGSGHMSIVTSAPTLVSSDAANDTNIWAIEIVDSARSGHGAVDTRYISATDSYNSGVGRGVLTIHAHNNGEPFAYQWRNEPGSTVQSFPIAFGRWIDQ